MVRKYIAGILFGARIGGFPKSRIPLCREKKKSAFSGRQREEMIFKRALSAKISHRHHSPPT